MPLGKKPDPAAPFDPMARAVVAPKEYALARYSRGRRAYRLEHAKRMAAHLQLTDQGTLPEEEYSNKQGPQIRDRYDAKLRDYPEMPESVRETLEDILTRYGLPLERLSTDVAAFVLRRVLLDYHFMPLLQREYHPALFTAEELVELMRVLRVNPHQLADLLAPHGSPQRRYSIYVQLQRWIAGINKPVGLMAQRVNHLIAANVRRKRPPEVMATVRDTSRLSQAPETVRRREDKRRQREAEQARVRAPLSKAALKALEDATD